MQKLTTQILTDPDDIRKANSLVVNTYKKAFGLNYLALDPEISKTEQPEVLACLWGNSISSTLTIFNSSTTLPSNQLFDLKPPKLGKGQKIVEIGRLAKSMFNFFPGSNQHIDVIALLKMVVSYAQRENIRYWQATLHPHVAKLLTHELNLPFHVEFEGRPAFHAGKEYYEQHLGSYLKNGMLYVWSDISLSHDALKKLDISEFVNINI